MRNVLNPSGPIPSDEPVFIIRAKDRLAGATLNFYADQLRAAGVTGAAVTSVKEAMQAMKAYPGEKEIILPVDMPAQPASVREAAAAEKENHRPATDRAPAPETPHGRVRGKSSDDK